MRSVLFLFLVFLCFIATGQNNHINLALKATLSAMEDSDQIQLTVKANPEILTYAQKNDFTCRYLTKSYYNIILPVHEVVEFAREGFIKKIDFHLSHPKALMDSSRVIHQVNQIHNGDSLFKAYTGEGVLTGVIDGAIEFRHDDFKDSLGNTRILSYWRQEQAPNALTPSTYGYGRVYDSAAINSGSYGTGSNYIDHGSTVAGAVSGNGLANGYHKGVAPNAKMVHVSSNFSAPNWRSTVADAVHFTFHVADSLNLPMVINASIGDYLGSHDGLDPIALYIDSMLNAKPGRLMVCAGGNSGEVPDYHLKHQNTGDTSFTWINYNSNTALGTPGYFTEWWMDSTDAADQSFSVAFHDTSSHEMRAISNFHFPVLEAGVLMVDTLKNGPNVLGVAQWYSEQRDGQYYVQIYLDSPDSIQHKLALISEGMGEADCWSASWLGLNNFSDTLGAASYPWISKYKAPDSLVSIVDSWACSPNVVTVANFYGRVNYLAYDSTWQSVPGQKGYLSVTSSKGPTRTGGLKPELTANGDMSMAAGSLGSLNYLANNQPWKLDFGGMHMRNGGTSMASPIVAGVGALLLEKCPKMTPPQFKNLLALGAMADTYTGITPNYAWGNGKLNAWQTLLHSNFDLGITGDTLFCENGMVSLNVASYDSIVWSNGQMGTNIMVDSSQWIQVEAWDQWGCYSRSDSIYITEHPLPPVPVISFGADSIYTSLGYTYQWYLNGAAISNSDSNAITPLQNGTYQVEISDGICSSLSDTVFVGWVALDEEKGFNIRVYPNPSAGELFIEYGKTPVKKWEIYNVNGDLQKQGSREMSSIDIRNLSKGLYFLTFEMENGTWVNYKFVRN